VPTLARVEIRQGCCTKGANSIEFSNECGDLTSYVVERAISSVARVVTAFYSPMVSASFASPAAIGFGTYRLKGDDVRRPLREAILAGYRHIDTAGVYKNEAEIGETLHELQEAGVIKRAELYLTSKLCTYHLERNV
jgi:hypothetical protein